LVGTLLSILCAFLGLLSMFWLSDLIGLRLYRSWVGLSRPVPEPPLAPRTRSRSPMTVRLREGEVKLSSVREDEGEEGAVELFEL